MGKRYYIFNLPCSELQELYVKYKERGFEVLAFPCNQFLGQESGTNEEIKFSVTSRFKVQYQLFDKVLVNGDNTCPLYKYLKKTAPGPLGIEAISWS